MTELDQLDREIIRHLTENSRKSFRQIAEDVDASPATVTKRAKKLLERGTITKYTVDLDQDQIGYPLSAIIKLDVTGDSQELRERLADYQNITSMYHVTGSHNVVLIGKFRDERELSEFTNGTLLSENRDLIRNADTEIILDTFLEHRTVEPTLPESEQEA